jgi:hypothetical protein
MEPRVVGAWDSFCLPSTPILENAGEPLVVELNPDQQPEEEHESVTDSADNNPPWCPSPNKGKEKEKEVDNVHEPIDTSLFVTKSEYEDLKTKYARLQVGLVRVVLNNNNDSSVTSG